MLRASFGIDGTNKAERCMQHKGHEMVDVRNKKCLEEGCTTTPSFGIVGSRNGEYCVKHKLSGMVDV